MIFVNENDVDIANRKHAAFLLSERLMGYRDTDACVVSIPLGGVPVGYWIANQLNLHFYVMPCRMITLPGKVLKSLGSISVHDVFVHDEMLDVPQTYVYHQIQQLRNNIESEFSFYSSLQAAPDFRGKTVLVVDDVILHSDGAVALLRSIRAQQPARLVVAAPFITEEAAARLQQEADDVVFLCKERNIQRIRSFASSFSKVAIEDVKEYLLKAGSKN